VLKKKQKKLDVRLEEVRDIVQQKEALIKVKEDEKSRTKAQIEDDNAAHELQFRSLRLQLEEQKNLMASQRK
jgi:hypothetical protein